MFREQFTSSARTQINTIHNILSQHNASLQSMLKV